MVGNGLRTVVPPRLASTLAWTGGLSVLLVALLAAYVRGRRSTPPDRWVDAALRPLRQAAGAELEVVVTVSAPSLALALCLCLGACALALGHWELAALSLISPAVSLGATYAGKVLVQRQSATLSDEFDAFPSGHAAGVFTVAALVFVLTLQDGVLAEQMTRARATVSRLLAGALALSTGLALTALRDHYVTDVLASAGLAIGSVALVALVVQAGSRRLAATRTAARPTGPGQPPSCSPVPRADPR